MAECRGTKGRVQVAAHSCKQGYVTVASVRCDNDPEAATRCPFCPCQTRRRKDLIEWSSWTMVGCQGVKGRAQVAAHPCKQGCATSIGIRCVHDRVQMNLIQAVQGCAITATTQDANSQVLAAVAPIKRSFVTLASVRCVHDPEAATRYPFCSFQTMGKKRLIKWSS